MTKDGLIHFEYQVYPDCTVVALDARLDDFKAQPAPPYNGQPMVRFNERTIKDCRNIDGCIYFHLGKVSDRTMCELIEKFQKLRKEKAEWKHLNPMVSAIDKKIDI